MSKFSAHVSECRGFGTRGEACRFTDCCRCGVGGEVPLACIGDGARLLLGVCEPQPKPELLRPLPTCGEFSRPGPPLLGLGGGLPIGGLFLAFRSPLELSGLLESAPGACASLTPRAAATCGEASRLLGVAATSVASSHFFVLMSTVANWWS